MYVYLFITFLLLLIWYCSGSVYGPEYLVVSRVDGKPYSVKEKFSDNQKASDILAELNALNIKVIAHMEKKYANTKYVKDVEFLSNNYNGDVLSEHTPLTTVNTSYVLNKGDLIKLCLRDPDTKEFHDFQTLLFVNLHELSHLLDRQYGHNLSFWEGFKTILHEAVELGIYTPINYENHPVKYCGLVINNNPYYDNEYKKN